MLVIASETLATTAYADIKIDVYLRLMDATAATGSRVRGRSAR
jgi:hypothetical protein